MDVLPEFNIDFKGQQLVVKMAYISMTVGTLLAFIIGYVMDDVKIIFGLQGLNYLCLNIVFVIN
jgi:hypothetical protein